MKHSEYVEIAKNLGINVLKKSIISATVKAIPFFALGLPNTLLIKLATWLAGIIVNQAEMMIFFKYIDLRTDSQARDFEAAMIKNHQAQLTGTDQEKKDAEKILTDALYRLVNLRA